MKKLMLLFITMLSLHSFAQNKDVINDADAEKRKLSGSFSAISVTDGIELFLTQGNDESIAVSASDAKYMERYKTEVIGGKLRLYYDNKGLNWTGNEKRKLRAYVSFKVLEKLEASGGASVKLKSLLAAKKLECTFTSGAGFSGKVNVEAMDIAQNSGADIELSGKAANLTIDVSSGAIFKGYDLNTDFCAAKASSGGGIRIYVNKELTVKASSGGGIRYKGDGIIKEMNVSSGGIVKKG